MDAVRQYRHYDSSAGARLEPFRAAQNRQPWTSAAPPALDLLHPIRFGDSEPSLCSGSDGVTMEDSMFIEDSDVRGKKTRITSIFFTKSKNL